MKVIRATFDVPNGPSDLPDVGRSVGHLRELHRHGRGRLERMFHRPRRRHRPRRLLLPQEGPVSCMLFPAIYVMDGPSDISHISAFAFVMTSSCILGPQDDQHHRGLVLRHAGQLGRHERHRAHHGAVSL